MSADLDGDFGGTFPFEARYLDLGDISIHYVDEGPRDGAPILMLHGNPTWSYMYRRPIRSLSERGHRAIAFDHMGFGRSSKPPEPRRYILSSHVQNAIAVLDQLDLNDVTLVCHDWGGPIGLGAALDRPGRVSRVVAMNTWACNKYGGVQTVGLCHGVQHAHWQITHCIEVWAKREGLIGQDETIHRRDVDVIGEALRRN